MYWHEPLPPFDPLKQSSSSCYVTIHKSTEPSPSCHRAIALLLECQLFLLQFRLRPSHFNFASHHHHHQSCNCNPEMSSILFCVTKVSLKVFLTFITKATMSPSSSWNDQFPNKLKGQFFCNLISKCNRCIYRYFSFINHSQSVSVWLNCFA